MVLFLCTAVVVLLLACFLGRIKISFRAELLEAALKLQAELCLLFGLIRIPMKAETGIAALAGRTKKKKKKKRPQRKRLLRLLLSKGRRNGAMRLTSFSCRGLIGNAQDTFLSVMGAGSVQVFFEMALRKMFPSCRAAVRITPSFERNSIWIYMEGILEILPTHIISVMIQRKGERNA